MIEELADRALRLKHYLSRREADWRDGQIGKKHLLTILEEVSEQVESLKNEAEQQAD